MGLDMFLLREVRISNYDYLAPEDRFQVQISVTRGGKPIHINVDRVTTIKEEVAYWRKANAIHSWFVKNVQEGKDDCGTYYVSRDDIKNLMQVCQTILDNPSKAEGLLPTSSGFFFGSTEYDDWYFGDLKKTVDICKECLSIEDDIAYSLFYHSSW